MPTSSRRAPRGGEVLDLPLMLDPAVGSQALRVHAGLRAAILEGRLAPGLRLPSSRALAVQLGIRRNAVVAAYEHLSSDGLIETRVGAGSYVTQRLPVGPQGAAPGTAPPDPVPWRRQGVFAPGRAHADPVLLRQLGRALRRVTATAGADDLDYADPRGSLVLRQQVAAYLAASRGIQCDPGCILIVSGTQQGLRLCASALLRQGDAVWMEDPGYPTARRALAATGLAPVPVPVDGEGLDVAAGCRRHAAAKAAYVTSSHQFPTGVTLGMDRRAALLDWARGAGAWVLEDDYDSEFRYAGPPLTALAGMGGGDRVIYLGTFSKTLFPALRLGYVVLPPAAVAPVVAARAAFDRFPPTLTERAVASLMADGTIAAHMRRMRTRYRAARDTAVAALAEAAGDALDVDVPTQGLHLVARLPADLPPGAAAAMRDASATGAGLLSETRMQPDGPDGFILGFSGYGPAELKAGAMRLGHAVRGYVGWA